jgi:hypothetical protein
MLITCSRPEGRPIVPLYVPVGIRFGAVSNYRIMKAYKQQDIILYINFFQHPETCDASFENIFLEVSKQNVTSYRPKNSFIIHT